LTAFSLINQTDALNNLGRFDEAKAKLAEAEELIRKSDSLKQLDAKIQLRRAQIALNENDLGKAVEIAEKIPSPPADSSAAMEIRRIIAVAKTKMNPKAAANAQLCEQVLQLAGKTTDSRAANNAKLSIAEAYLLNGNPAKALTAALEVKDYFAGKNRNESAWRALFIAAAAEKSNANPANAREFAAKALETLQKIKSEWGEDYFKNYLSKPDIRLFYEQAGQMTTPQL
jgi:tetratricopeptide (TPR) repeat protein